MKLTVCIVEDNEQSREALVELLENASEELVAQLPIYRVSSENMAQCMNLTDLLSVGCEYVVCSSKGEARKAIQGNAISINKVKVLDPQATIPSDKIRGKYVLVGNGKQKNYIFEI